MRFNLVLLLFLLGTSLSADDFTFSAGTLATVTTEGRDRTILQNGAEVQNGNMTIRADEIDIFGQNYRFSQARDGVEIEDVDEGLFITANEVFFDRDKNYSRIQGNAVMEDRENEILVKGDYLEVYEDEDLIIIQIQVRILKENLVTRSEMARFDRANDMLYLSGLPVVYLDGDEYRADEITIDLDTEEIFLDGQVSGSLSSSDEEDE